MEREKRNRLRNGDEHAGIKRARPQRLSPEKNVCIFCGDESGLLHEFRTLEVDSRVRSMATDLQDTALLAKIEGGDLIALDAKYHLACLTQLRNWHRSLMRESQQHPYSLGEEKKKQARVFAELITYIENSVEDGTSCFKFSELRHLFENCLLDFGINKEMNKVLFKEKILEHFPEAQAQSDGNNTILVFQQGMLQMLKQAFNSNYESDAIILSKAAKIICEDIFNMHGFHFNGSFPPGCQQQSVPTNLKYLVSMLLNGPNLRDQDSTDSQTCVTISQTIVFNCKIRGSTVANKSRHSLDYKPPLPLYIGMNVDTQTRSKKLITQLCQMGLSVSYVRILQLENQLATSVCEFTKEIGLVCPIQLHHGLFTVGALDNLDHNPSSTTAKDSFHGTGISLFQLPTVSNEGYQQSIITLPSTNTTKKHQLPEEYTTVPAVVLNKDNIVVPKTSDHTSSVSGHMEEAKVKEKCWLEHGIEFLMKDELEKGDAVSWASYHA